MGTINNYFRSNNGTFFFNDRDHESARAAYDAATKEAECSCVFKPFTLPGPWHDSDVIGIKAAEPLRRSIARLKVKGEDTTILVGLLAETSRAVRDTWNRNTSHAA